MAWDRVAMGGGDQRRSRVESANVMVVVIVVPCVRKGTSTTRSGNAKWKQWRGSEERQIFLSCCPRLIARMYWWVTQHESCLTSHVAVSGSYGLRTTKRTS